MQINYSALTAVAVTLAIGITIIGVAVQGLGWWHSPLWPIPVGMILAQPLADMASAQVGETSGSWQRWAFQTSCGLLAATLFSPVHNRLRERRERRRRLDYRKPTHPRHQPGALVASHADTADSDS
ncbi:hypothetical protein [Streptomyces sp. 2A115]|uniref:hypothetical protein n=1 Tax=Streptomyces sp. 2A115 TaxID=3457439 RepID=UPI003FD50966